MKFLIIFSIQFSSRNPEYVRDQMNLAERRKFEFDQIETQENEVLRKVQNNHLTPRRPICAAVGHVLPEKSSVSLGRVSDIILKSEKKTLELYFFLKISL